MWPAGARKLLSKLPVNEPVDNWMAVPWLVGGNSKIFCFLFSILGEDEPIFDYCNILQMGWFNHQLVGLFRIPDSVCIFLFRKFVWFCLEEGNVAVDRTG